MPLMPSRFSNPWINTVVCNKLNPINGPDYDALLFELDAQIANDPDTPDHAIFLKTAPDPQTQLAYNQSLAHLRKHWYEDGQGSYWPKIDGRKYILHSAMRELITRLRDNPRSCSIFWICDHQSKKYRSFQAGIFDEPTHVTLTVLTPWVDYGRLPAADTMSEHVFVVSDEDAADEIVDESADQGLSEPVKNTPTCHLVDVSNGVWLTEVHTVKQP